MTALKTELYDACLEADEGDKRVWRQLDFEEMEIVPAGNVQLLTAVVQMLVDEKLFKIVQNEGSVGWKLRGAEEARKCVLHSWSFGMTRLTLCFA